MLCPKTAVLAGVLVMATLPACKIVPNPDPEEQAADAPLDDDQRMALLATQIFDDQLPAYVQQRVVDAPVLREQLVGGLDGAGQAHGIRPTAEGSPWNFIVSAEGVVVTANRESRAATLVLDTTGDGAGDVTVQLGPVVRGTSLRDALDFLVFTEFRDQIEFAKLARALNDQAYARLSLPEADLTGQRMAVTGAMTLTSAEGEWVVVPTALEVRQ